MASEVLPLTTIGIIIVIAIVFSVFVKKLRQNEVIGFILAGFLLGPFFLNFLHPKDPLVTGFAELGLFVLLFYLGIELSLKEFLAAGSAIFSLAIIDMIITTGLGAGIMLMLGHSLIFSAVVGIMLFSTSTAIVAKFIIDKNLMQNAAAKLALSVLILQDFLGVLLLVFITGISEPGKSFLGMAMTALAFAVCAFYGVYQLSSKVEDWMKKNGFGHTEITLYALGIGLIVATLASTLGLSTAIGAYFAGFALSETESGRRIKKDVEFLRDFFLVFFFVGFGTTIFFDNTINALVLPSLNELAFIICLAFALGIVAITAHSISLRFFGQRFGLSQDDSTLGAILLSPLGEFVVIIATVATGIMAGAEAKLLSPLAFLLILITLLMFFPLYEKRAWHKKLFSFIPALQEGKKKHAENAEMPYPLRQIIDITINLFVIACFSWVAILLYKELPRFGVPIVYSRQITSVLIFIFFASVPLYKIARAFKRLLAYAKKEDLVKGLFGK